MKYNNKLIVVGDIHLHHTKADKIIQRYEDTHKIVFVGDYFDDFNDTPQKNEETALWLKTIVHHPSIITLRGNHDENYDPRVNTKCAGFSHDKKRAINSVLSIDDWDRLSYFHYENGWLISHAGINKHWFFDPMKNSFDMEYFQIKLEEYVKKQRIGDYDNGIWACDEARGGKSRYSGILWQDWKSIKLIENFKQIVGHSPIHRIQRISDNIVNSHIVNVDCSLGDYRLKEVLEIDENGQTKTIQII
jgi:hypothetical protein